MAMAMTHTQRKKTSSFLFQEIRDHILMTIGSYRGPRSRVVPIVTDAVLDALYQHHLETKARPFKSEKSAKASGPGRIFAAAIMQANGSFLRGYLRQVRKTVKRKGKPVVVTHYLDSNGLSIPSDIARSLFLI